MAKNDTRARDLGTRIRDSRLARNLSQAELAEAIGSTIESVSRAERGTITPTLWTLQAMAEALDLDLATLVGANRNDAPPRSPLVDRAVRALSTLNDPLMRAVIDLVEQIARDGHHGSATRGQAIKTRHPARGPRRPR